MKFLTRFTALLLIVWGVFAAWCVWGFPPAVDLPAHGAQLETLANLLKGDPDVARIYTIKFPMGYGLPYWIFLPLAMVSNGAVAIRVALWVALFLFPISLLALARAFHRSDQVVLSGLPLAFNFSYWYGLLSGLFAQPLVFLSLALFQRTLEEPNLKPRRIVWLNVLTVATLLSHLVAFVVLILLLAVLCWVHRPRLASLRLLLLSVTAPLLLSLQKAWVMANRAVLAGPWPATEFNAGAHLNWFFKNYGPEGKLGALGPILVAGIFFAMWLIRGKEKPAFIPALLFAAIGLYCITPKTLSGIFLIHARLPVFVGMLSLLLVDWKQLPPFLRAAVICLSIVSLAETAVFHWRFSRATAGLAEMIDGPSPGKHGYIAASGPRILGSRHIYAEHLGQWVTATRGGVGHYFFAGADHHPVDFRPGVELPTTLVNATTAQLSFFDTIFVFGDGPLPPQLRDWRETMRVRFWRRLERPPAKP